MFYQKCYPNNLEFKIGLFSNTALWEAYSGEIGNVEGIDMSSINKLLEPIDAEYGVWSPVASVRISQWNSFENDRERRANCKNTVFYSESSDWTADCNLLCVVPVECHGLGISIILIFIFYRSIAEELIYYFQNLFLFK